MNCIYIQQFFLELQLNSFIEFFYQITKEYDLDDELLLILQPYDYKL